MYCVCLHTLCYLIFSTHRGIENVQAGIGTQAGVLIKDVTIFLVGIVWAFFINWKLAFVVFTLLPIVSVLGGLCVHVSATIKMCVQQ